MSMSNPLSSYSSHHHHASSAYERYGVPQHPDDVSLHSTTGSAVTKQVQSAVGTCCSTVCAVPRFFWDKLRDSVLLPLSQTMLSSSIWRAWLVIGNFILLFGNPIQMLVLPAAADPAADVLYTLVFGTFMVDMVFRSLVVAGYFSLSSGHIYNPSKNCLIYAGQWLGSIRFPSFLFMCDLFSTLTLLADISFTNPASFRLQEVEIDYSLVVQFSVSIA